MNFWLNEYFKFSFELNIELNHFWARFNVWLNNRNVSARASLHTISYLRTCEIQVSLQMLKVVDLVKGEEIAATTFYHRLTKENSELLRRYCFYLKLKIHQL